MKKSERRQPPPILSQSSAEWWRKVVAEWDLDHSSLLVLQSGLEARDRMLQAQEHIAANGLVSTDRFGQLKANPCVLIERDSRAAMLGALKALNLDLEPLRDGPGRPPKGAK